MNKLGKIVIFSAFVSLGVISSLAIAEPLAKQNLRQQEQVNATSFSTEESELNQVPVAGARTLVDSINGTLNTNRNIKILQESRDAAQENVSTARAGYGLGIGAEDAIDVSPESSP